jgi:hypothetical protein
VSPTRQRFAEVVRAEPVDLGLACLLVGGEVPGSRLDVEQSLADLDALAALARPLVPRGGGVAAAAEGLRLALGERAGFAGSGEDYADLRSSLLHEVLRRRRGCRCCCPSCGWRSPPGWTSRRTPSRCPATSSSASATRRTSRSWSTPSPAAGCSPRRRSPRG